MLFLSLSLYFLAFDYVSKIAVWKYSNFQPRFHSIFFHIRPIKKTYWVFDAIYKRNPPKQPKFNLYLNKIHIQLYPFH